MRDARSDLSGSVSTRRSLTLVAFEKLETLTEGCTLLERDRKSLSSRVGINIGFPGPCAK